jgi:IS1 family transposase/transposase-like protein
MVNTEMVLFCPRKSCTHYQSTSNKITKDGTFVVKTDPVRRQMFYCHGGGHRFSETAYSDLFGKHGNFKEYEQTAKLTTYGLSSEQIADVLEKDTRTIIQWQKAISKKCQHFHLFVCLMIGINILFLQMDEMWSYIKNKEHQLWCFIAFESQTKFWIGFELGSRTTYTANRLVNQVKKLGQWHTDTLLRVTTDKLAAYKNALQTYMAGMIPYAYLQIVKTRIKRRLVTVKKFFVRGSSQDFPPKTANTSFIERLNLTLRQRISYLQRKTLGYCKNKVNFKLVLWINLFDYNYGQFHKSLRVDLTQDTTKFKNRYQKLTPAMKIGLAKRRLDWKYLMLVPILQLTDF